MSTIKSRLAPESIMLMYRLGWKPCGGGYWDHPDYPMQQFHESEAIVLARAQQDRKNMRDDT